MSGVVSRNSRRMAHGLSVFAGLAKCHGLLFQEVPRNQSTSPGPCPPPGLSGQPLLVKNSVYYLLTHAYLWFLWLPPTMKHKFIPGGWGLQGGAALFLFLAENWAEFLRP